MTNKKELSNFQIIIKGWILINIPATIIILTVWYVLETYLKLNNKISVIIGGAIAWIYWELTIKKWVKWALENNVEPEKLLKIGQLSLLLWNRKQIDETLKNK